MTNKPEMQMVGVGVGGKEADPHSIGQGPKKPVDASHASNKALLDHARRYVEDWWLNAPDKEKNDAKRQFSPMIIAVCANGDIVPIVAAMAFDEDEKEGFALNMRKMFQVWKVQRYAFISEAWLATYSGEEAHSGDPKKGRIPKHMQPSNRNDRREVAIIAVAGKDEEPEFYAMELVRDWNTGLVTGLEPFDSGTEGVGKGHGLQMTGRFMELLEPPPFEGNPALNPANIEQIAMLAVILDAPEKMRGRYEKFGQDFDAVRTKGRDIKSRLAVAYDKLAKAPEPEWEGLCEALNAILQEASVYGQQVLSDINERRAREQPAN